MLGRDKLVLHLVGLLLRRREDLAQSWTEILLPALHAWKTRNRRLCIIENNRDVRAQLTEHWSNNAFRLFEHRDEQVLGFDLLVLVSFSKFDCCLDCFLPAQCKFV